MIAEGAGVISMKAKFEGTDVINIKVIAEGVDVINIKVKSEGTDVINIKVKARSVISSTAQGYPYYIFILNRCDLCHIISIPFNRKREEKKLYTEYKHHAKTKYNYNTNCINMALKDSNLPEPDTTK